MKNGVWILHCAGKTQRGNIFMPFSSHYPRIWDHNTPTRSSPLSSSRDPTGPPECQKLWWEHAYLLSIICPKLGIGLSNFQNMEKISPNVLMRSGNSLDPVVAIWVSCCFDKKRQQRFFFGCCIIHMGPIEDLSLWFTFRLNLTLNIQVCLHICLRFILIKYPACPTTNTNTFTTLQLPQNILL